MVSKQLLDQHFALIDPVPGQLGEEHQGEAFVVFERRLEEVLHRPDELVGVVVIVEAVSQGLLDLLLFVLLSRLNDLVCEASLTWRRLLEGVVADSRGLARLQVHQLHSSVVVVLVVLLLEVVLSLVDDVHQDAEPLLHVLQQLLLLLFLVLLVFQQGHLFAFLLEQVRLKALSEVLVNLLLLNHGGTNDVEHDLFSFGVDLLDVVADLLLLFLASI